MNTKKFGALSSSVDPSQLSATIEGLIAFVAGMLVFAGVLTADQAHFVISSLTTVFQDVIILIPLVISMFGICRTVFGLLRKAVVAWATAKPATGPIAIAQDPGTPI